MSWTNTRRLALLALAAILLIAAALRVWRIDSLPPGFHFDESFEGLEAWRILTDPGYRPIFLTGNFGVTPLNAYANAVTFALFGLADGEAGPAAMRTTAAVAGVLGVLAVFALATELRQLDRRRLTLAFPLLAAAVLATLRWHIHFSRMGIEPIFVPLFWAAATWLLLRGWRLQSWASFAGCGLMLALAMYSYQGAWIIPFLMIPVVAHLWLADCRLARLGGPAVAAGVALLLVLPLAWFFVDKPDLLLLRPTQLAVIGGHPAMPASPWQNALASVLMFVPLGQTGDLDPRRNLPGAAALNWWQFVPFVAGAALALWRVRNPAYSTLLVGLIGLLLPGVFSEYAPHFHRILGAAAPAALLCGLGLDALVHCGREQAQRTAARWPAWIAAVLAVGIVLGGAVVAARDYFVRWAALPDLFYAFDTGLWQIGQELAGQPAAAVTYLTPRPADHPTLAFALAVAQGSDAAAAQVAAGQPRSPISFDGRQVFPLTEGANKEVENYVVIQTEDFRTRLLLPEVLPQASIVETITEPDGTVYANVYTRPKGALPGRPPEHALDAALGDAISLAGYDLQPASPHPGEILYLQLHWRANAPPAGDWTVFTHLLRPDGAGGFEQVAGSDSRPGGGSLPTPRWQAGWRVLDEYQIPLPGDLAPGIYTLAAGLYRADGARLPADGPGIVLGDVIIE